MIYHLRSEQAQFGTFALPQPPDSILWKCNGNKVVEFTGSEETVYPAYEGRVTLNWHTAELQISDLRYEDSGKYEYEVFIEGSLLQSSYDLEVIGRMSNRLFLKKSNIHVPQVSLTLSPHRKSHQTHSHLPSSEQQQHCRVCGAALLCRTKPSALTVIN